MYQVVKRDSSIVAFDLQKITAAIKKAFDACRREYTDDIIDLLGLRVTADFEPKIHDHLIQVEDIQDSVESILSQSGYADVAKAYILYRMYPRPFWTIKIWSTAMSTLKTGV